MTTDIVTERLFADLDAYAGDIVVRPASVSNSPELVSACAHPAVRGDLRAYLDRAAGGGHLLHDLDSAFDWR